MGFIEETGAAQHYRDARITPIYEGTNGIQALDLAGRKLTMAGRPAALGPVRASCAQNSPACPIPTRLSNALAILEDADAPPAGDAAAARAARPPYLRLFGSVLGGFPAGTRRQKRRRGNRGPRLATTLRASTTATCCRRPWASPRSSRRVGIGLEIYSFRSLEQRHIERYSDTSYVGSPMRRVTSREANQQFSSLLALASGGEEIVITRRGEPVATLAPYRRSFRRERAVCAPLMSSLNGCGTLRTHGTARHFTRDELHER